MNNGVYFIHILKCEKSIIISELSKEGSWKVIKKFWHESIVTYAEYKGDLQTFCFVFSFAFTATKHFLPLFS